MSLEKPTTVELIQEVEDYLQENYPVKPENVENVLKMLRNYEEPGFPDRKGIVVSTWTVKATDMAKRGYDYRFGAREHEPETDLATLVTAVARFRSEIFPETRKTNLTMWKVKLFAQAELENAIGYMGSVNAKIDDPLKFMQKARYLYGLYEKLAVASGLR